MKVCARPDRNGDNHRWIISEKDSAMRRHVPVGRTHDSLVRLGGWTSLVSLLATFGSPPLHAAPSGGEVTAGSGAISQSGTTVTIDQSSSRLAIDWQRFDIGAGESVTFVQPSAQ